MKSVLVIGAAGFVGPYLVNELRSHNYKVIPTKLENQKVNDRTFINLDVLNFEDVLKTLKKYKPNYIVHLAAQANVGLSWKDPILTFNINVMGSLNLLEAVRALKLKTKILLIGTSEEYGHVERNPVKETSISEPNNFYALSKITQEKIGKIYVDRFGLNIVFVRAFNHIGPGQAKGFVVPDFCTQIVEIEQGKREPVIYVGNLSSKRDFSDVRDIVRAYRLLLEKGRIGEIYNVGSGEAISIQSILDNLLKLSNKSIKVLKDKTKIRPVDTPVIKANINKLVKDTKYNPHNDISKTLTKTLEHYRNQ